MDERDLIAALRQRDQTALAQVFAQYSDRIYRLAVSLLHDEQEADGVVQDTFLSLIEHIDGFEGRSSLGTWLYRVAHNNIVGRLRRARPQLELDELEDGPPMPEKLIDWESLPEAVLTDAETSAQIAAAIERLPPTLRSVFLLRDIEDLSTAATAQALGISPAAVKVRLHRARLALREALAAYFEERMT